MTDLERMHRWPQTQQVILHNHAPIAGNDIKNLQRTQYRQMKQIKDHCHRGRSNRLDQNILERTEEKEMKAAEYYRPNRAQVPEHPTRKDERSVDNDARRTDENNKVSF